MSTSSCIVAGLLTGFGLDQLAGKLSGPKIDRATLQLVGVSFASILFPGLYRAFLGQQQDIFWHRNEIMDIAGFQHRLRVEGKHQMEVLSSQSSA
eukprot:1009579-Amphidinium_carterae.1